MSQLQGMMSSFGDNVTKINAFISTLTGTFKVQGDLATRMKTIDARLQELDQHRQQEEVSFRSQVDSLNAGCAGAFRACRLHRRDRESFKMEENRIVLQTLSSRMDTLSLTGDTADLVSPVSHFVRGLGRFNEMKYQDAIDDLRIAREMAKQQMRTPLAQYGNWDADEVQRAEDQRTERVDAISGNPRQRQLGRKKQADRGREQQDARRGGQPPVQPTFDPGRERPHAHQRRGSGIGRQP